MKSITEAPKGYSIKKMNDNTYAERRLVIDEIYKAKTLLRNNGFDLPRIEVRICDLTPEELEKSIARGRLNANQIWVSTHALKNCKKHLYRIVLHEVIHAVKGVMHPKGCPLMDLALVYNQPIEVQEVAFINYFKKK